MSTSRLPSRDIAARVARHLLALLWTFAIAGCGLVSAEPDWVTNRLPLESCGVEEAAEGLDADARSCLLEAYEAGRGAELVSTRTTVEGDPITRYIRVHQNGTVEIFEDATRDSFASTDWERIVCERLISVEEANEPPAEVFIEVDCEPLPIP